MRTIETPRLLLRGFNEDDFEAVHNYASSAENTAYMLFGPNSEDDTRAFIKRAMATAAKEPLTNYSFAVVLKETGNLIGACDLSLQGDSPEVGWILHKNHWGKGYGTEMGRALLELGFAGHNLHRIVALCDMENVGSSRIMEKLGMRREGMFREYRRARDNSGKLYRDELSYAILKDEWEAQREIGLYNALPVSFDGFITVPALADGELFLVCTEKQLPIRTEKQLPVRTEKQLPVRTEKKPVETGVTKAPTYVFAVCLGGEKIGEVSLRVGYGEWAYFAGQVNCDINAHHRGKGYATRACRLMVPVAKAHGMEKLLIASVHGNAAAKRVCEKLGAKFLRTVLLPEWMPLYRDGGRYVDVFEWAL